MLTLRNEPFRLAEIPPDNISEDVRMKRSNKGNETTINTPQLTKVIIIKLV